MTHLQKVAVMAAKLKQQSNVADGQKCITKQAGRIGDLFKRLDIFGKAIPASGGPPRWRSKLTAPFRINTDPSKALSWKRILTATALPTGGYALGSAMSGDEPSTAVAPTTTPASNGANAPQGATSKTPWYDQLFSWVKSNPGWATAGGVGILGLTALALMAANNRRKEQDQQEQEDAQSYSYKYGSR